jgi:nucleoside-diphosphate-sugar epimerase
MAKRILIFGATGATGTHLVKLALDAGLEVRAYARSPDKIPADLRANPKLEVFRGDLNDLSAIDKAVEGVDMIVSTAGDRKARPHMMTELITQVVASMRKHGVKRLVYQAGAFSPMPGEKQSLMLRIIRPTVGAMVGLSGMLADNDDVMAYLVSNASDLDWTVSRPSLIKNAPSKGVLKPSKASGTTVHFVDLAAFDLSLAQGNTCVHEAPYPTY